MAGQDHILDNAAIDAAIRRRAQATSFGDPSRAEAMSADNAAIDVGIARRAQAESFGKALLAEGVTIVVLDESGRIIERRSDGSSSPVD